MAPLAVPVQRPTWRRSNRVKPTGIGTHDQGGFTLIEALASLVLLGLLAGVVFPNMSRWYDAIVARQLLSELTTQVRQLAAVAVFTGRDFSLADVAGGPKLVASPYRLNLPAGWAVRDAGDLRFLRTGMCRPGAAWLRGEAGREIRVSGNALCEVELTLEPAPLRPVRQ